MGHWLALCTMELGQEYSETGYQAGSRRFFFFHNFFLTESWKGRRLFGMER